MVIHHILLTHKELDALIAAVAFYEGAVPKQDPAMRRAAQKLVLSAHEQELK